MNEQVQNLIDTSGGSLDFIDVESVELEVRHDGKVVWLSVDGVTVARVWNAKRVVVNDRRGQSDHDED